MIRKIFLIVLFVVGALTGSAKEKVDQATLDSLFKVGVSLAERGRFEKSNAYFDALTKLYKMPLAFKFQIYSRMAINYNLTGDYKMMYKYLSKFREKADIQHLKPLTELDKDTLIRPYQDVTICYSIDTLRYNGIYGGCEITVPVEIGGRTEKFVIDNGMSKYSTVNETFAREHGIRPIGYEGSTSGTIDESTMWLGVADSLRIGQLLLKNIVFTVIPDGNITNKTLPFNAYLGANFFRLAGEMVFDNKKRTITFPFAHQHHLSNLTISAIGEHFAEVKLDGDVLKFHFDLGYSQTSLSSNYYQKYKATIETRCRKTVAMSGGVGGTSWVPIYYYDHPRIYFNDALYSPKSLIINTIKDHNEGEEFGKLGNDFLLSFRRVTLNLREMFMGVER